MKKYALIFLFAFFSESQISFADNYYWTGGSGNWSDLNHWVDGFGVNYAQLPSSDDNVIFNSASFNTANQTVTFDEGTAFCKNIDFSGVTNHPKIVGSNALKIYGSMTLISDMDFLLDGTIYFASTNAGNSITLAGNDLNCAVTFDGLAGEWTITDAMTVNENICFNSINGLYDFQNDLACKKTIAHDSGTLQTNSNEFSCHTFNSNKTTTRAFFPSNSAITIAKAWNIGGSNLTTNMSAIAIQLTDAGASFNGGTSLVYPDVIFQSSGSVSITECTTGNISFSGNATFSTQNSTIQDVTTTGTINFSGNDNQLADVLIQSTTGISILGGENNTFNLLSLNYDGKFTGNNNLFKTLTLASGAEYSFTEGKTQIFNQLNANGNCSQFIRIESSSAGKQAILQTTNPSVTLDYAIIKDLKADAPANFTASNSVNLGTVTENWTIPETPRTLYWIGNSGNWDETAHWSLTSGGTGGECIPSPIDNVIVDVNSFPTGGTITVNKHKAYCNDMTWSSVTNTPDLACLDDKKHTLRIYGSLQFDANMNLSFDGITYFEAEDADNTITMNGLAFRASINFSGNGGTWSLNDKLTVNSVIQPSLNFNNGTLNTNGNPIECYNFISNVSSTRTLNLSSSTITVEYKYQLNSENFTLDAGTSLIEFISNSAIMNAGSSQTYYDIWFKATSGTSTFISSNDIHKAQFDNNASITGNSKFDTLKFQPGKEYTLGFLNTQTIVDSLIADGTCNGYTTIKSMINGGQAFLKKETGIIELNYIKMQDIQGDTAYRAYKSVDLGNNKWTFEAGATRYLYWVGGTGDWGDASHWSAVSGGIGGECIPTLTDNVYFDENSFTADNQYVNINIEQPECKTMDWQKATGTPRFENSENAYMNIYGSLLLNSNMQLNFTGYWMFRGDGGQITTAGNTLINKAYFDGNATSEWLLMDSLAINESINLRQGQLKASNHKIKVTSFSAENQTPCYFESYNSEIEITGGTGGWSATNKNFTMNLDKTIITLDIPGAQMENNCNADLNFYKVFFKQGGSLSNQSNCYFESISIEGNGNVSNYNFIDTLFIKNDATLSGHNTINQAIIEGKATLNNQNIIQKLSITKNATLNDSNSIDTLIAKSTALWDGNNNIKVAHNYGITTLRQNNTAQKVYFYEDANLNGENTFDTIYFYPDRRYILESGKKQTVNHLLKTRGNRCFIISLESTTPLSRAEIDMTSGEFLGDYIEMEDIEISGNKSTYYAGKYSNNINNNGNKWIFENYEGYIYGFHNDTIIMKDSDFDLSSDNFNGDIYTNYEWSTGDTTLTYTPTTAGRYWLIAKYGEKEGKDCSFSDSIDLFFAQKNDIACKGDSTGSLTIEAEPLNNYQIKWSNQSDSAEISNLKAGSYSISVTATDKASVFAVRNFTINQPDTFSIQTTTPDITTGCTSTEGTIRINATGTMPIYYKINDADTFSLTSFYDSLSSGTYNITVKNGLGCMLKSKATIPTATEITIDSLKTQAACAGSTTGAIYVGATGASGRITYSINDSLKRSYGEFENINAGNYSLKITDSRNCELLKSVQIEQSNSINLSEKTTKDPDCYDGRNGYVLVEAKGGTGTLNYALNNGTFGNDKQFYYLKAGQHTVSIKDSLNCRFDTIFTLNQPEKLTLSLRKQNCLVSYTLSGGVPDYEISFTDENGTHVDTSKTQTGTLKLFVTDANGCQIEDSITINPTDCQSYLEVPNVFTPNGDGINDNFTIPQEKYRLKSLEGIIYNRWGQKIYTWKDFDGWDGTLPNGQKATDGIYYYLIKATGIDNVKYETQGFLNLYGN